MIKQLVSFQFIFLFCPVFVISLVVYGSDFNTVTGWVYLAALTFISLLHLCRAWWTVYLSETVIRLVLLLSVVLGLWAYRQIHFYIWDEHSLGQSILISLFAVLAYFGSVVAPLADDGQAKKDVYRFPKVMTIFSLCWLPTLVYPQSVFLAVVLCLGLGLINLSWSPDCSLRKANENCSAGSWWGRYVVFILTLDMALVIWDYKVNAVWAGYIAVSLLGAAVGGFLVQYVSRTLSPWVLLVLMLNLVVAVIFPNYVLNTLHSVILGMGVGLCLGWLLREQPQTPAYHYISGLWPFVLLGFMLSYALYAHLILSPWRSIFIIPILYLTIKTLFKQIESDAE